MARDPETKKDGWLEDYFPASYWGPRAIFKGELLVSERVDGGYMLELI